MTYPDPPTTLELVDAALRCALSAPEATGDEVRDRVRAAAHDAEVAQVRLDLAVAVVRAHRPPAVTLPQLAEDTGLSQRTIARRADAVRADGLLDDLAGQTLVPVSVVIAVALEGVTPRRYAEAAADVADAIAGIAGDDVTHLTRAAADEIVAVGINHQYL
ncbi:hypothetical protein [Stackebrandtia soli]|uniref:hypothetical protein n=1 Tax=Stackebrandtia soli TaxID=1892856 RepID=UPI0039E77A83